MEDLVDLGIADLPVVGGAGGRVDPRRPEEPVAAPHHRALTERPGEPGARRELLLRGIALVSGNPSSPAYRNPPSRFSPVNAASGLTTSRSNATVNRFSIFAHARFVFVAHTEVQREIGAHTEVILDVGGIVPSVGVNRCGHRCIAAGDAEKERREAASLVGARPERIGLRPRLGEIEAPARIPDGQRIHTDLSEIGAVT